jgi:hypothetical protein
MVEHIDFFRVYLFSGMEIRVFCPHLLKRLGQKKSESRAIAPLRGEYRGASGMSVSLVLPFPGTESFRQSSAVFPAWKQGSLLFIYSSKIVKRNLILRVDVGANNVSKKGYITVLDMSS